MPWKYETKGCMTMHGIMASVMVSLASYILSTLLKPSFNQRKQRGIFFSKIYATLIPWKFETEGCMIIEELTNESVQEKDPATLLKRYWTSKSKPSGVFFQIQLTSKARYSEWERKTLRSRQRNNYKRFWFHLPSIRQTLTLLTVVVSSEFVNINKMTAADVVKNK
jgi:hypothetical protein